MKAILPFFFLFLLSGCFISVEDPFYPKGDVLGYKPIYAPEKDLNIEWQTARPIQNPGKIYVYNNLLLVNERFAGIHVINNINPANPQPVGFISIAGNVDMAIKNNILYADNQRDLVAIQLDNMQNMTVLKRFDDMLPEYNLFPEDQEMVFFECVDPEKGIVIGWEKTMINNPKCYKP